MTMSTLFIETLKVADGKFSNPVPHQKRIQNTLLEIGIHDFILPDFNSEFIPKDKTQGTIKCRCLYNGKEFKIEYEKYQPRIVKTLKLVCCDSIDYHLKYADRDSLNRLLEKRSACDNILIVKNGEITDTSYSNVVFYDGIDYYTPRSFLLNGTKRQQLIAEGKIKIKKICPSDIKDYKCVYLINAMLDIEDQICVKTEDIIF